MSARALAAPLHRHTREDEYSYVIEGRMGALLGDDVLEAGPGDLVFKPRGEWHTFWNAGDEPCRILEIISPAGFERFFAELVELGGVAQADPEILGGLCRRYELEMDPSSVPDLVERFGVRFPAEPL
jgi:gentisate 1,2-dioxygenase